MLPKFIPLLLAAGLSCKQKSLSALYEKESISQRCGSENYYQKIENIPLPRGCKRINCSSGSFAEWLRNINLKRNKTVYKFDGTPKSNQTAQFAVLDISVGSQDLQQCADAVIRLKAEYLYNAEKFDEIIFTDNNNTIYKFREPYTRHNFDKYLQRVFGMCGSASLAKQLKQHIEIKNINAGDVIVRGGFPGHAVIVMDMAINNKREKFYLLAQGYMPAQDIHILINPSNPALSPWYETSDETKIQTPEYTFS
ncbi:MAG TPA: DUF4846 domain-containing protein, partial [Chitinophagaceae bacterium]|nr:DUF4846 domain-containing protein [Chitinophagaceae bacterium]